MQTGFAVLWWLVIRLYERTVLQPRLDQRFMQEKREAKWKVLFHLLFYKLLRIESSMQKQPDIVITEERYATGKILPSLSLNR